MSGGEDESMIANECPSPSEPQTAGAILAAARRERQLSVIEIGERLRLSTWQIEALEEDRYDSLSGPTFVRGIIRGYAKTLQIDPQPALDAYGKVAPQTGPIAIDVPSQNIRFQPTNDGQWKRASKIVLMGLIFIVAGA